MQLQSCQGLQATQRPVLTRVHPEVGRSERVWGWATAPSPAHAIHLHPARAAAVEVSTIERDVHHAQGTVPAEQPAQETDVISWTSYWWPVQAVVNLDPKIPVHVDLLGQSLVVWGDSQGNWHCLEDKCPHRLAPLSEGRVEKGQIMCCYHGWTFSGTGACTSIPQLAGDSKAHASACSSKRSCVAAYPTKVAHGLLWIWPEAGLEAAAKAAATQPHEMAYGGDMAEWYVRDIPLRSDTLLENLVDPGHVPYSHHGVMGNRYKPLRAFPDMKVEAVDKTGMATVGAFGAKPLHLQFLAPFRVTYYTDPKLPGTQLAAVPTKPGWSRVFLNGPQPRASPQLKMLPLPVQWLMRIRLGVTAINHITARSAIFDGDDYMLHVAQRLLPPSKGLGNAVARSYYMPAPEDAMVIALRKWFEKHGGEMPTASAADEAAMQLLPKEQVLDRWHQHTKHCSHCLKGLATLDKVQSINVVVGLAAAVALVAQAVAAAALARAPALVAAASSAAANPLASWWQACQAAGVQHGILACAVLAAASYGLYRFLAGMRQLFYYEEYVHAMRD